MISDTLKKSSLQNFKAAKNGKRVVLFGAGEHWVDCRADVLDEGDRIPYVVDNDPGIQGGKWHGLDIHAPGKLGEEEAGGFIVLITHGHVFECAAQLEGMGIFDYFALYLFHDYFISRGIVQHFPGRKVKHFQNPYVGRKLEANLNIIDICNLRCKMCSSRVTDERQKNAKGEVPYEKILSILDQVAKVRDKVDLRGVLYTANGESLLHSRFADIVRETKERNLNVRTITNGVLLKADIAVALLKADAEISISITGIIPEVYKDFQGYAPTMERTTSILDTVVKNVTELTKLKAELHSNAPISVLYLVTKENAGHFVDYLSFFTGLGVDVNTAILVDRDEEVLPDTQYVYKDATGEGYGKLWVQKKSGYFNSLPCFFPFIITMDGDVNPCCHGRWQPPFPILGNVHESSLFEILFSESTLNMIRAIDTLDINKMPELCKVCKHLMA